MSKIALNSNASGTGVFTIASPNSDTDRTLTLPDEAGTIITTAGVPSSALPTGSVLQVVSANTSTRYSTSSTTFQTTDLSASFTPKSSTSKILLLSSINANFTHEPGGMKTRFFDVTESQQLGNVYNCGRIDLGAVTSTVYFYTKASMFFQLDSWGVTAKTIRIDFALIEGSGVAVFNENYPSTQDSQMIIMEIAA